MSSGAPRLRLDLRLLFASHSNRRRDPRAIRQAACAIGDAEAKRSRLRRDPRVPDGEGGATRVRRERSCSPASVIQIKQDLAPRPSYIMDDPAFYVAIVLSPKIQALDRAVAGLARSLAVEGGAVIAFSTASFDVLCELGVDRVVSTRSEVESLSGLRDLHARFSLRHVVLSDTVPGRHLARCFAVECGLSLMIGVIDIREGTAVRASFGGAKEYSSALPTVLTLAPGWFEAAPSRYRHEVRPMPLEIGGGGEDEVHDLGPLVINGDDIPLEEAPLVMAAGAGVRDWAAFNAATRALNATRGGSRVVCDAGHMPRDRQIGASGRSAAAELYIAVGVSGAVQHLQGIENCRRVVAVNNDRYAPIVSRADLTLLSDADSVLRALAKRVEVRK